ncbi:hypothetical protein 2 [Hubei insect virus 2]|uniref:hypothetical protein 2 n=1 Tax=Hubei insect virus 2 TaxID=1922898 RepID=UPI0009094D8D|nr:hypothetical protein 2 [Hubei insect virus 2]APG79058.1 hypothetical protein 2 [Hubei insect virus 2]
MGDTANKLGLGFAPPKRQFSLKNIVQASANAANVISSSKPIKTQPLGVGSPLVVTAPPPLICPSKPTNTIAKDIASHVPTQLESIPLNVQSSNTDLLKSKMHQRLRIISFQCVSSNAIRQIDGQHGVRKVIFAHQVLQCGCNQIPSHNVKIRQLFDDSKSTPNKTHVTIKKIKEYDAETVLNEIIQYCDQHSHHEKHFTPKSPTIMISGQLKYNDHNLLRRRFALVTLIGNRPQDVVRLNEYIARYNLESYASSILETKPGECLIVDQSETYHIFAQCMQSADELPQLSIIQQCLTSASYELLHLPCKAIIIPTICQLYGLNHFTQVNDILMRMIDQTFDYHTIPVVCTLDGPNAHLSSHQHDAYSCVPSLYAHKWFERHEHKLIASLDIICNHLITGTSPNPNVTKPPLPTKPKAIKQDVKPKSDVHPDLDHITTYTSQQPIPPPTDTPVVNKDSPEKVMSESEQNYLFRRWNTLHETNYNYIYPNNDYKEVLCIILPPGTGKSSILANQPLLIEADEAFTKQDFVDLNTKNDGLVYSRIVQRCIKEGCYDNKIVMVHSRQHAQLVGMTIIGSFSICANDLTNSDRFQPYMLACAHEATLNMLHCEFETYATFAIWFIDVVRPITDVNLLSNVIWEKCHTVSENLDKFRCANASNQQKLDWERLYHKFNAHVGYDRDEGSTAPVTTAEVHPPPPPNDEVDSVNERQPIPADSKSDDPIASETDAPILTSPATVHSDVSDLPITNENHSSIDLLSENQRLLDEIKELREMNANLSKTISEQKDAIASRDKLVRELTAQIWELTGTNNKHVAENNILRNSLRDCCSNVDDLKRELCTLNEQCQSNIQTSHAELSPIAMQQAQQTPPPAMPPIAEEQSEDILARCLYSEIIQPHIADPTDHDAVDRFKERLRQCLTKSAITKPKRAMTQTISTEATDGVMRRSFSVSCTHEHPKSADSGICSNDLRDTALFRISGLCRRLDQFSTQELSYFSMHLNYVQNLLLTIEKLLPEKAYMLPVYSPFFDSFLPTLGNYWSGSFKRVLYTDSPLSTLCDGLY